MSFTGDLEHLPIVDIIQLLHAARKSGTLTVHNSKGDNQLVFRDGFIVSANNSRNNVRIGRILLEINAIKEADLEQALAFQKAAGADRKPLVTTLIERGLVAKEDAFKGLEILIEKTVLEILIWKEGSFTFDVDVVNVADEYRYIPEKMKKEINLNSQNVLMEALRLYDEKKRDGELETEFEEEEASLPVLAAAAPVAAGPEISADILGLADIDKLERKIPDVFIGLADPEPDPLADLQQRLAENAPDLPPAEREEIAGLLAPLLAASGQEKGAGGATVILFSADPLLGQALTLLCKQDGLLVFATDEVQDLDMMLARSLGKGMRPLLVFDRPAADGPFAAGALDALRRRLRDEAPQASCVQLVAPGDAAAVYAAHATGARLTLPRPVPEGDGAGFGRAFNRFVRTLVVALQDWSRESGEGKVMALTQACCSLRELGEPREVALSLLRFVSGLCPRALILVVGQGELVIDRGIGLAGGDEALTGSRFAITDDSLLATVAAGGRPFFGPAADPCLADQLQRLLGPPATPQVLLLPVLSFGKARFLIYADFADGANTPIPLPLCEILAVTGGLVLENALYRKKLQKGSL
ncbi:response regulator [Desulfuromonas carbonis]|uniref:DUF4388 domain-containing protein n=1 Tax=Desulfuromonas sp. DDH964 TaxID=1823759 RepID=UPI00078E5049|nr:DUF4388 domain-containing protein [Desulfuromonas sp. DDH964]AMV71237.1 hypothetical protein DBW_0855 [Desulfuromonas sp. DDH964]